MAIDIEKIIEIVKKIYSKAEVYFHRNQYTLIVSSEFLLHVAKELKDNPDCLYDMLTDITAIDWLRPVIRYEVVYFLYSTKFKDMLRLKVPIESKEPVCPSVVTVWESADWYERETYDMYGIHFEGHPNLRRFYMPEDYTDPISGEPLHPLRKDFPLMGIPDSLPLPPYPEKYGELGE